jgi:hypothetical protein
MAKFIIGLIVGIFLGAATSAYATGAVGRIQESAAFIWTVGDVSSPTSGSGGLTDRHS